MCYFKMLLPIFANPINMNNPVRSIIQAAFSLKMLVSSNNISDRPITNEPNKVFDNEKKYSASFSFRVLSFSLFSFSFLCCIDQFPIFSCFNTAKLRITFVNATYGFVILKMFKSIIHSQNPLWEVEAIVRHLGEP